MKGVYYMDDKLVNWIAELQSIAQAGLTYGKDVYDRERYQRIREITAEMMAAKTGLSLEKVTDLFCGETGYQMPKWIQEQLFLKITRYYLCMRVMVLGLYLVVGLNLIYQ